MLKLLVILGLSLFLSGCSVFFYDYGVNKSKTKLPYRTFYSDEEKLKTDFETVVYSNEGNPKYYNYTKFYIKISHMSKELVGEYEGKYVSCIEFGNIDKKDMLIVNWDKMKLTHRNKNGDEIPDETVNKVDDENCYNRYYKKVYKEKLPDDMEEYIHIEFSLNGVYKTIEYKFPIKKDLHYTSWDIMMGV